MFSLKKTLFRLQGVEKFSFFFYSIRDKDHLVILELQTSQSFETTSMKNEQNIGSLSDPLFIMVKQITQEGEDRVFKEPSLHESRKKMSSHHILIVLMHFLVLLSIILYQIWRYRT